MLLLTLLLNTVVFIIQPSRRTDYCARLVNKGRGRVVGRTLEWRKEIIITKPQSQMKVCVVLGGPWIPLPTMLVSWILFCCSTLLFLLDWGNGYENRFSTILMRAFGSVLYILFCYLERLVSILLYKGSFFATVLDQVQDSARPAYAGKILNIPYGPL